MVAADAAHTPPEHTIGHLQAAAARRTSDEFRHGVPGNEPWPPETGFAGAASGRAVLPIPVGVLYEPLRPMVHALGRPIHPVYQSDPVKVYGLRRAARRD